MTETGTGLVKAMGDYVASMDLVSSQAFDMDLSVIARTILDLKAMSEEIEQFQKNLGKDLRRVQFAMMKKLLGQDLTSVTLDIDGHRHQFTVVAKAYLSPPPKTKEPENYAALLEWLQEHHPDAVVETTTIKIGGSELSDFCRKRLEEGLELPPHVREHNEMTIRDKRLKDK